MKRRIWKIFRVIWVIAGLCFVAWMFWNMQAKEVSKQVLESDSSVQVLETKDFLSFTPTPGFQKIFIFYPGALVDPIAYAPLCRKIAAHGYQSLLIKMPWRMANNGYNKIKSLNLLNDTSKQYILCGHSQGAKMAAQFVHENPLLIDKLILIATTHPRDYDLSKASISIMKIYGSNDGVAAADDVEKNKSKLPANTNYVLIEGANHAQFGYYGYQLGDSKASISREEQQQITLENILSFMKTP